MSSYIIVWHYDIDPAVQAQFEAAYGPAGDWASLFRRSADYLGTQLLRDVGIAHRYVTLDHWLTEDAFLAFKAQHQANYDALDRSCESLTVSEVRVGAFWCHEPS